MSKLYVNQTMRGRVTVLELSGDITIGDGSVALRTAIHRLLEEGKKMILLDLARVKYIDSAGMGELVSGYTSVRRAGGELKLLNLTLRVRDLLTITKLLTVFEVFERRSEAIASFGPAKAADRGGE